jgi:hypothetical protein
MIHEAIQSLRPGKGFVMYDDDPQTIIWEDSSISTPTKTEIDKAVANLEKTKAAELTELQNQKNSILERLGITADEAALLLK